MNLNQRHTDMIFDATEHQYKWYRKYYIEEVTFIKLLQLNTESIEKFIESNSNNNISDIDIENKICDLKKEYINRFVKTKRNRKD